MSTTVFVSTYTYSVTYVTGKLLAQIKDVVRLSGLDPGHLTDGWACLERGISTWLRTQHLEEIVLEVYDPKTDGLVGRWDFEIYYGFSGDGSFWVDPAAIRYHILKQGVLPSTCRYRIVTTTKTGRPDVWGWSPTALRSTAGFVKQSIGTTIDGSGLSAGGGYWRRAVQ